MVVNATTYATKIVTTETVIPAAPVVVSVASVVVETLEVPSVSCSGVDSWVVLSMVVVEPSVVDCVVEPSAVDCVVEPSVVDCVVVPVVVVVSIPS